jgi:hypothetical protein
MFLRLALLVFATAVSGAVTAQGCYETSIKSPSPYLNNGGEVVVLMDGTIWKDASYNYSYAYQFYPAVTVCPRAGFMIMNGKKIALSPLGGATTQSREKLVQESPSTGVIESRIDGEFKGWDGETIFKLQNGQIWQQASYAYTYHYAYSPLVLIVNTGSGYLMQVDGLGGNIKVRRLH